jgi:tRNA(fMet)-specific endonuclease VapC
MNGSYLIDTSVVVAYFRSDATVVPRLDALGAVFLSAIVVGELYVGARKSTHVAANLAQIDQFAGRNSILPCDAQTAFQYGLVRDALYRVGHPIPDNDIWIAATALPHTLTLVTRDAHFQHIVGLSVEAW